MALGAFFIELERGLGEGSVDGADAGKNVGVLCVGILQAGLWGAAAEQVEPACKDIPDRRLAEALPEDAGTKISYKGEKPQAT